MGQARGGRHPMKKIIIPRGHIWLQDALLQFEKLYRARKEALGKLDISRPWWKIEVLDEAVTYLQLSLVSGDLDVKFFGQTDIEKIGRAFWSMDEADSAIRFGRTKGQDGSERYLFLATSDFQAYVKAYEVSAKAVPEQGKPSGKRGPRPKKLENVKVAMRRMPRPFLASMKEVEMSATFEASRDTCRKAREEVLSEITGG